MQGQQCKAVSGGTAAYSTTRQTLKTKELLWVHLLEGSRLFSHWFKENTRRKHLNHGWSLNANCVISKCDYFGEVHTLQMVPSLLSALNLHNLKGNSWPRNVLYVPLFKRNSFLDVWRIKISLRGREETEMEILFMREERMITERGNPVFTQFSAPWLLAG